MFIVLERFKLPHSFRCDVRTRADSNAFLSVNRKHRTPKGVPVLLSFAIYKHSTPPE